jgi:hypothetical protein
VVAQRPCQQVGRVDVVGQLRPDEQAALRRRPRRLAGQELLERGEHDVAPAPVDPAQLVEVLAPVAVLEVLDHEVLIQRRGAQVRGLLAQVQALQDRRGSGGPADPQARREDLRERARVGHVAAAVERVERRQRVTLVAQQAVRVVLEDHELLLVGDPDERLAPVQRHRDAAGVLEVRDRVDELGAPALVAQLGQRRLEHVDPHAVVVHLDLHDVGLVGVEARHGAGIRGRLGDHDVAGIEERAADEVDHLLAAGRDHDVVGLDLGALGRHHLHDALADVVEPVGRPVLERRRARVHGHPRHQHREVLGRERRRVRQAGGQ